MTDPHRPAQVDVDVVRNGGAQTRVTRVSAGADGRTFVLVAGIGVAATYFEFLAPLLAEHGEVYALDLPGFAGMPPSGEDPTPAFFADQVEEVLSRYGLQDPVLIGHSMGTQVVTEVLTRRDDISHAVLVSPVIDETHATLAQQAMRFALSTARESLHLALTALAAYLLCGLRYFLTVLPHMMRYRMTQRIALGHARLLIVRGEYDLPSPRSFHSRLVEAAEWAARWEIQGAAHSIINGHAVGVARLIVRHVDDDLARRGRLTDAEAAVPPARHADVRMVLAAVAARISEWVSAVRGDQQGVERAKVRHSRVMWLAYRRRSEDVPRRPAKR